MIRHQRLQRQTSTPESSASSGDQSLDSRSQPTTEAASGTTEPTAEQFARQAQEASSLLHRFDFAKISILPPGSEPPPDPWTRPGRQRTHIRIEPTAPRWEAGARRPREYGEQIRMRRGDGQPPRLDVQRGVQPATPGRQRRQHFPDIEEGVPPEEAEVLQGPVSELEGAESLVASVSSPDSIETAKNAGIPGLITGDATVLTKSDFPDILPDKPFTHGRAAPQQRQPTQVRSKGEFPVKGREISKSQVQNLEILEDVEILERAGAQHIRINQRMVTEDITAGTNRPDLYAELNGRRIHIEYDRAPGTRSMVHARRILTNDPDAIVILKIIDFERIRPR